MNGSSGVLLVGIIMLIVVTTKSQRKLRTFGRVIGLTLLLSVVVGLTVFVLINLLPHRNVDVGRVTGDFTGIMIPFGLVGNSIRQRKADKRDQIVQGAKEELSKRQGWKAHKTLFCLTSALVLSVVSLSATARADDHVIVTTVSHYTSVYHYTVNTPSTSTTQSQANATCSDPGGTGTVNCSGSSNAETTTYPGQTVEKAVYTYTEMVNVNGQTYTLQRVARWAWSNTDEIPDGQQFDAIIKKNMI